MSTNTPAIGASITNRNKSNIIHMYNKHNTDSGHANGMVIIIKKENVVNAMKFAKKKAFRYDSCNHFHCKGHLVKMNIYTTCDSTFDSE